MVVVERLEGETIARQILRDDAFAAARPALAAQCGEALAAHPRRADRRTVAPALEAGDQVAQYREVLDTLGEPHPAFELGFRWLEAQPAAVRRAATVVHGDFRLGNLIVGPDGMRGGARLGAGPRRRPDGGPRLAVREVVALRGRPPGSAASATYDELFDGYEAASGPPVDREALRWWEMLGTLKWGIMCIMQASPT